jgi:hypothetical protein
MPVGKRHRCGSPTGYSKKRKKVFVTWRASKSIAFVVMQVYFAHGDNVREMENDVDYGWSHWLFYNQPHR